MKIYKNFLRNCIFSILSISFAIVVFCSLTDPYEVWNIFSRQGFNLYSVKGENIERLTKPLNFILHHKNSKTVILGSSRSDYALNPETWKTLTGKETYNFSVTSCTTYESRRYLEHILANSSEIEEIILCVDFFAFADNSQHQQKNFLQGFDEEQIGKNFPTLSNLQKIIFSWNAVKDGILNLKHNFSNSPTFPCHDFNGKFSEDYIAYHYGEEEKNFLNILHQWKKDINFADAFLFEYSLEELKKIVELCRENNLKLYVCILPLYPLHYECFNDCWKVYNDWKIRLVDIHEVYDFTCFDENIAQRKNFWDTSHIKINLGDKVLNSIYCGNLEFGEILTPENVQSHNLKITAEREVWKKNHSAEVEESYL